MSDMQLKMKAKLPTVIGLFDQQNLSERFLLYLTNQKPLSAILLFFQTLWINSFPKRNLQGRVITLVNLLRR